MAEDWRLSVELPDRVDAEAVLGDLRAREAAHELRDRLGGRVAVSSNDRTVFLYASSRWAAEAAERALRETLEERRLPAAPRLDRWHPIEERWEDATSPLPETSEERLREYERLQAAEAEESRATGVARWEVRIELPGHGEAVELAERLEAEGRPVTRRWTYVLVGAANREEATSLAAALEAEAPAGAVLHVEPGAGVVWEFLPANPFAVFGGLAG